MIAGVITGVLGLLGKLPGLAGDYFARQAEIKKIQLETQRQIAIERQKLAAVIAENEFKHAQVLLNATGRVFKYVTFFIWFGPFLTTLVFPQWGVKIFDNMALMPSWYAESIVMIMFAIWGLQVSKNAINSSLSGLRGFFKERRQDKIHMKQVDKKAFFDGLRAAQGFVTQQDVEKFNKILNKMSDA
jgi:hypothetical protein